MDRASSLIFPGSRTLVSWWRQLASHAPQALWVGYAFLHRVEAPVVVLASRPVDPFAHLILQALDLEQKIGANHGSGVTIASLQTRLRIPAAIVHRAVLTMHDSGWLTRVGGGDEQWRTTESGRHVLEHRIHLAPTPERRVLTFVERMDADGQRSAPPHLLPIAECVHVSWQVDGAHRFERRFLEDALAQSPEWKNTYAVPADIKALASDGHADDGQHVLLDRPERVLLIAVNAGAELLCYAAKVDGWSLFDRHPVVRLPIAARDPWPELAQEPGQDLWVEAWHSWCRQRQMPASEVDACTLTFHAPRLEIHAPQRLVQRLQAAKSDLFKGEAWILVGDGFMRTAALLTIRT